MSSPARVIRRATVWSGRKPEPVTRCPLALIVGVADECGAAGLFDTEVGMGRSYRAIGPARWSMLRVVVERRPECGNSIGYQSYAMGGLANLRISSGRTW